MKAKFTQSLIPTVRAFVRQFDGPEKLNEQIPIINFPISRLKHVRQERARLATNRTFTTVHLLEEVHSYFEFIYTRYTAFG